MLHTLNLFTCHLTNGKAGRAEMKSVLIRSGQRALGSRMIEAIPCYCGTGCDYIFVFVSVIEFYTINEHFCYM